MTKKEYNNHKWQPGEKVWTILYVQFEIKDEMGKWIIVEYPKQVYETEVWGVTTTTRDVHLDLSKDWFSKTPHYLSCRREDLFLSEKEAVEHFQKIKESRKTVNLYLDSVEKANRLLTMYNRQNIEAENNLEIWKEEKKCLIHDLLNMDWLDK